MLDRVAAEALFLEHRDSIRKAADIACRNHGVFGADAEDFASSLVMKLIEDDYAVVRRFRGESDLRTYFATVAMRHFVSHYRSERGRWRPSTRARRLGPVAVELETLVNRDRHTLAQAGERLRTTGRTTLSDGELARLLGELPGRAPLRPVVREPETGLDAAPGSSRADERVFESETDRQRAEILRALDSALEELPREDQMILRAHDSDGQSLADVARMLGLEQKPLYRRIGRIRAHVRAMLERAGLTWDEVRGILPHGEDAS